ncbi:putative zinc finger protein 484 isoform x1 [Lasius niger]|uniref:Putative zinc finger protein 484 isoform x1 n=1 Tax=Lasius niger TaxID=67767 RepID=A0A0J7KQE3_LASNI|nr:putative zinc finger protein 484 isoform x1 [Lasius niger]
MTADSDKDCTHCLVCNSKVGVSTRNSVRIFNDSTVTASEKPLADIIATVLKTDVNEESVHSLVICKKCYKLFNEVDELETRLTEIKLELFNNYKRTVKKLSNIFQNEEEYNDHDYIDNTIESQNIGETEDMQTDKDYTPDDTPEEEEELLINSGEILLEVEDLNDSNEPSTIENYKKKLKKGKVNVKVDTIQEQIVLRDESSYSCLLCTDKKEKVTADAKTIIAHMKDVHDARLYICDVCGQDFRKRNELSLHLDDHVAKEEGDFQCEKPYQCEFCGATFSQRSNLQSHKRATHYNDKRYKCDKCQKGFKRRRLLDYHIKAAHTGERPYKCDVCTATFVYPEHFKKHRRIHTGEKPYLCEVHPLELS